MQNQYKSSLDINSPTPVKLLTVGAGAIGGFYSAKLARAGLETSLVCRSDYDTINRNGMAIHSIDGDFHYTPHQTLQRVADYGEEPDYLLLTTKVLPEIDVAALIRPAVAPRTAIVLLQNGIDIEPAIARAFPNNELISGLAFVCVSRTAPGVLHHTCFGRVALGRYPDGESPRAAYLADCFERVAIRCQLSPHIVLERWRKLIWNAAFNPISVLAGGLTTREMVERVEIKALARAVMEEVTRLAAAAGYPLPAGIVQKNLDETQRMEPYKTSMLLDFISGRAMEVEAILGNAVRLAEPLGVEIPHLRTLYALLRGRMESSPPG